ncbi:MAG TPA: MFS transporter, partial [Spirochaetales bacterium]|nr:MFS transporter [Spirochaetales bacterium]
MNTALKDGKSRLSKSFTWLNATQFLGALNDNIFKLLIIFFLIGARGGNDAGIISAVAGAVFVIPFLLFSAASGIIADRISKQRIIVIVKAVEVAVMFLGTAAFFAGSELGLYLILFLMAAQSALFGPSKYGIVPELVRTDQLSRANSYLESFTYLAVILGSALAPMLSQAMSLNYERAAVLCVGIAAVGLLTSFKIEATAPAGSTKKVTPFFIRDIWETLKSIRQDRYLFMTVLGSAYFMFIGAFIQINLIPYGMETLKLTQEQSGYLFFAAALGIGTGSFLSGRLSGRNIEFGVVPLGALGLSLSAIALSFVPPKLSTVIIEVLIMGVSAGLYIVPLYSFIQFRSPAAQRGEILAASGFLGWSGVLLASGLVYLLSGPMGIPAAGGFLIIGLITMVLTLITMKVLPDFFARFIVIMITKLCYRIRVIGAENIPMEGPALLVPNHVSWADPVLLTATTQRRIRFVMQREFYNTWYLKPVFDLAGVIPISPDDPPKMIASSIKQARAALDDGYMVCIFAEGSITRSGFMHSFKEGMEKILKRRDCPVIPVYLGGVWGSIFSYAHGKLLSRMPVKFPYPVTVLFGQSLPSTCSAEQVRQAVTELSSEYVNSKKQYRKSLGEALVKSARRHWKRHAVSDTTGINLSYGKMMTAVIALAAEIKREAGGQEKVGVLLPTTVGGALVNMSLAILGKVPVNLNYTASPESIQSAIDQCSIRTTITSKAFLE